MKTSNTHRKPKRQDSINRHRGAKSALSKPSAGQVDGRSKVGRALGQWRQELVEDLGGESQVSTQQLAVVDLAVRTKLLLDSIDAWLLQQTSLVNKRKKALIPAVHQRQQLADALSRYMGQLGWERKEKRAPRLDEYLAEKRAQESGRSVE